MLIRRHEIYLKLVLNADRMMSLLSDIGDRRSSRNPRAILSTNVML